MIRSLVTKVSRPAFAPTAMMRASSRQQVRFGGAMGVRKNAHIEQWNNLREDTHKVSFVLFSFMAAVLPLLCEPPSLPPSSFFLLNSLSNSLPNFFALFVPIDLDFWHRYHPQSCFLATGRMHCCVHAFEERPTKNGCKSCGKQRQGKRLSAPSEKVRVFVKGNVPPVKRHY